MRPFKPKGYKLNLLLKRKKRQPKNKSLTEKIIEYFFLAVLNFAVMSFIGFLTIDSFATINSRISSLFIAILLPYFISMNTLKMDRLERFFKFGAGMIVYLLIALFYVDHTVSFSTFLTPAILLFLGALYFFHFSTEEEEDDFV